MATRSGTRIGEWSLPTIAGWNPMSLANYLSIPAGLKIAVRRIAFVGFVAFAIGAAAVGRGNRLESRPTIVRNTSIPTMLPVPIQPVTAATEELLQPAGNAVTTLAMPAPRLSRTSGKLVWMEVTAYCPCKKCCGKDAIGLTASGKDISYNNSRFVAADTDTLPFGTKLLIPGYGEKSVEVVDRGGAIKGRKLDVFFPTHNEALKWGRQWIAITVVE